MNAEHKTCAGCGRQYLTTYSGAMRKHRCEVPVAAQRTVRLRSGGHVTLTLSHPIDPLRTTKRDRELLSVLADQIDAYESKPSQEPS